MPSIVTTLHDPIALAATCERLQLSSPELGSLCLDGREAFGWIVRLPKVRFPIVCDTLTGLIAYHSADNAFAPFAHIMCFLFRCYDFQALRRQRHGRAGMILVRKPLDTYPARKTG